MAMPLLMTGPGGDYVNRFDAQGSRIIKTRGRGSDTESFTSTGQFSRQPRRQQPTPEEAEVLAKTDMFEHTTELLQSGVYRMNCADPASGATTQPGQRPQTLADRLGTWLAAQRKALGQWHGPLPRHLHEPVPADLPRSSTDVTKTRARRAEADIHRRAVAMLMSDLLALDTPDTPDASQAACGLANSENHPAPLPEKLPVAGDETLLETDHEPFRQPDAETIEHSQANPGPAPGARLFADDAGARRRIGRQQGHGLRTRRSPHQKRRSLTPAQQGSLFGG